MEYRRNAITAWDEENPAPDVALYDITHYMYQYEGSIKPWSVLWGRFINLIFTCCRRTKQI